MALHKNRESQALLQQNPGIGAFKPDTYRIMVVCMGPWPVRNYDARLGIPHTTLSKLPREKSETLIQVHGGRSALKLFKVMQGY